MKFETFWKETRIFAFCLVSASVGAVIGSGLLAEHAPALAPSRRCFDGSGYTGID